MLLKKQRFEPTHVGPHVSLYKTIFLTFIKIYFFLLIMDGKKKKRWKKKRKCKKKQILVLTSNY